VALRDAVLAALLEGESSGYDLAKSFDASVANFWTATPQQLYRELDRLATDGFIAARVVHQERRPTKRMYSLTDAGDAAAVRDLISEQLRWATAKLARYERLRERLLHGRTEDEYLAESQRVGPYLTLLRGISFEQENIRWGEHALSVINQRLAARGSDMESSALPASDAG
jgi:DNA-binding PadR family transcriptional regulator